MQAMTELNLPPIEDELVPKIMFLSIKSEQETALQDDVTSANNLQSLINSFKRTLLEKNVNRIRRAMEATLLYLRHYNNPNQEISVLERNLSGKGDTISEEEERILEFTEIFQMFSIPVPEFLKEKYDTIVASYKIPVPIPDNCENKVKYFFIYTERKIFMEICDLLTPLDVYKLYLSVRDEMQPNHQKEFSEILKSFDEKALSEIPGLKDVAFYFLILEFLHEQNLNRLHTHTLRYFLKLVLSKYQAENEKKLSRFKEALNKLKHYPVGSDSPGLCIILSMEKGRDGADKDVTKVSKLFKTKYGYHVFVIKNPTSSGIKATALRLQHSRNKFYDSLIVWFMGHGTLNRLYVKDGIIHRRRELIDLFSGIQWFIKKPKLFFIQACLLKDEATTSKNAAAEEHLGLKSDVDSLVIGTGLETGSNWRDYYGPHVDLISVNNYADTLIAYATNLYKPASRNEEGSLYVQTVVDQLEKNGHKSIENVLRKAHYYTNTVVLLEESNVSWKQTPYYESSLQKKFVFPLSE